MKIIITKVRHILSTHKGVPETQNSRDLIMVLLAWEAAVEFHHGKCRGGFTAYTHYNAPAASALPG